MSKTPLSNEETYYRPVTVAFITQYRHISPYAFMKMLRDNHFRCHGLHFHMR